jgi:hypothetical protein
VTVTLVWQKHPQRAALRARNHAFVAEVNARTVCAHCGAQPVEWHNPEHVLPNRQSWRIANLVWQPAGIQKITDELARCTPLCRRCHMREDGRLVRLHAAKPMQPGVRMPPSPCMECDLPYTPLRRGRCRRCYDRRRRLLRRSQS